MSGSESAAMNSPPHLIALDWGTSSLRAYLLADSGAVIDDRAFPWGIMATPDGDFAKALETAIGGWQARYPGLPMLAAGMIGSTQGWREIPYCPAPAGLAELVSAIRDQPPLPGTGLRIVPGVSTDGAIPNVMRGEETQVIGALELIPGLYRRSRLVLPGTHSKWVEVREGKILSFTTYLTGELFAVLSRHSILGRPAMTAGAEGEHGPCHWDAFERGVRAVRGNPVNGLSPLLFSTRTLVLSGRLAANASLDYLSGLLIGEELRCALVDGHRIDGAPLALIGEAGLCERYGRALSLFGIPDVPVVAGASAAGLWRIAQQLHNPS